MTTLLRSNSTRTTQRAQTLVEFTFVFPIFIVLIFGLVLMYLWQVDIDSAQFAAQEGAQTVGLASYPTQLLDNAGLRAYCAATRESFLTGVDLVDSQSLPYSTGYATTCADGTAAYSEPNPAASCSSGTSTTPTIQQQLTLLKPSAVNSSLNYLLICPNLTTGIGSGNEQQITLTVTVVGYMQTLVPVPFIGDHIPIYGQATQTVQEFQNA
ncbi:MAG: TadE/TadG family type IV pilus assembly protein [Candidatus Dormibacteria bacterium]